MLYLIHNTKVGTMDIWESDKDDGWLLHFVECVWNDPEDPGDNAVMNFLVRESVALQREDLYVYNAHAKGKNILEVANSREHLIETASLEVLNICSR